MLSGSERFHSIYFSGARTSNIVMMPPRDRPVLIHSSSTVGILRRPAE